MPLNKELKKVMVVGSGPIIIGQAAEFDYAGTQACRALREEGLEVVLINSNPATIMTDSNMADRIYIEPLTLEFLTGVIAKERPDGIVPGLGGQVGLNLAKQLAEAGVLDKYGVRLLGTPLEAIKRAEDRDGFKSTMESIGEPIPESAVVETVEEAVKFAETIGFPLVVRPAYTLGGTGGGMVYNMEQLEDITNRGLGASIIHQALIEKSLVGWKELEFEVMRDNADNCITICSMENIDPMGIHTGDSIVVAPTQTLSDREYQMLRSASLKIIRALGVAGGCNVQFALDPDSYSYYVIEVNPRVSRSSALASKATGYPIAKVSTKIAIGFNLDEIKNTVTGQTYACFEPSIDYAVVKFPRWPFDKFTGANRVLGTQMKATGEVMSIDRTLEGALLKAVRSLEIGASGLSLPGLEDFSDGELDDLMVQADDRRFFLLAEALRRGMLPGRINKLTGVDMFFLGKLQNIIATEKALEQAGEAMDRQLMLQAKKWGFADSYIAQVTGLAEQGVKKMRQKMGLNPVYKMVDTCAAEFEAVTPYYYSCYDDFEEVTPLQGTRVVVLGSGPIRIGQGIEFDYCNVHSVWALREEGIKAITVNNNPETVSTDFDTSDRLYFEPLLAEDVLNILDMEKPMGVIVQFGGQTPINLAAKLHAEGIKILGTSVEDIDRAEDRERFDRLLIALRIPKPPGRTAFSVEEAVAIAGEIGYPVLVRPSYVLGGRAMEIVYNHDELLGYMATAVKVTPEHPVLVDKYLMGVELELDAIADGETVLIPGIMRHVERAGVHSGDSIAVYPTNLISQEIKSKLVDYSTRLALALNIKGMINIQYVLYENEVYVLEVNPRASRTVPYMSKITGIPMVNLATKAILGKKLKDLGYQGGLYTETSIIGVKAPVFSFAKLTQVDVTLGPEMKSTGEVMGVDRDYAVALYKALVASGHVFPREGTVLVTVSDKDKDEVLPLVRGLASLGYNVCATSGTADFLTRKGLQVEKVNKLREASPNIADFIRTGKINLVLNTLTKGKAPERDGFKIRRAAVENGVPCLTSMDTAWAILEVLTSIKEGDHFDLVPLQEYRN